MRNRAKCRLCLSIIESFHPTDFVDCKCGEISVYGGDAMRCEAKDFNNFLRVDDLGNEIVVTTHDPSKDSIPFSELNHVKKKELLIEIESMIKHIENMPPEALVEPINQYDYYSLLLLMSSCLRSS